MSTDPIKQATLEAALAQAQIEPTLVDNWNRAAIAALQMARLEDAVEYIGQAIVLQPDDPTNFSNRGRILFALGRAQAALEDYSLALALAPTGELYSSRSVIYLALGREAAALSDLSDAIDLAPTAENYLNRAAFFGKKSLAADALRDINQVIALQSDDPNHRLTRANVAFSLGQNELALSDITAALRLDPTGTIRPGLLALADQLEAHLADSPQPDVSRRLIALIRS